MRLNMCVQSELHGLAALQWSICLDSLNRYVSKVRYFRLSHSVLHRIDDSFFYVFVFAILGVWIFPSKKLNYFYFLLSKSVSVTTRTSFEITVVP